MKGVVCVVREERLGVSVIGVLMFRVRIDMYIKGTFLKVIKRN